MKLNGSSYSGVPTERYFYSMGPLIGIEINNLKPSHSGNTYPLRFFANFDVKKTTDMAFDQDLTCLIFSFRWACFPIKIGRNAQWEHLFSMYFDDFLTSCLIF